MLEKTLEGPLDCEIKPVNHKGNQPWIFIRRTDDETEAPVLWEPDVKSRLIGKDPGAGKDWRQKERGQQRMRWLDGITTLMDMNLNKLQETVKNRRAWLTEVHVSPNLVTEQQNDSFLQNKMYFYHTVQQWHSLIFTQMKIELNHTWILDSWKLWDNKWVFLKPLHLWKLTVLWEKTNRKSDRKITERCYLYKVLDQATWIIRSDQSLSRVRLFATP